MVIPRIPEDPYQKLKWAVGFTDEDLQANRMNQLGPSQIEKYGRASANPACLGLFMLLLMLGIFGTIGLVFVGSGSFQAIAREPGALVMVIVVLGLVILLIGASVVNSQRAMSRISIVHSVDGVCQISRVRRRYGTYRGPSYALYLGKKVFSLIGDQREGFIPGQAYRVYYIVFPGRINMILSAERINL